MVSNFIVLIWLPVCGRRGEEKVPLVCVVFFPPFFCELQCHIEATSPRFVAQRIVPPIVEDSPPSFFGLIYADIKV